MNLNELYSDIVKEHSMVPHNKRHMVHADIIVPGKNPSCGDEISLELKVEEGTVLDASFTGVGCAISQTSVSIMTDMIKGKSLKEVRELATLFLAMSRRETLSEEELDRLDEAAALQNVSNMPARIKCATMPWHTLVKAVDEAEACKKTAD